MFTSREREREREREKEREKEREAMIEENTRRIQTSDSWEYREHDKEEERYLEGGESRGDSMYNAAFILYL